MTPEDRVNVVIALLENPMFPGHTIMMPIDAIRQGLLDWRKAEINAKLEEAAAAIEALERGTYTTAQTSAGLVRAMKEG